jgi:hypothetical protein
VPVQLDWRGAAAWSYGVALVRMRVRRMRKWHACRARKRTEVIVECVIRLGDDEHMIDGAWLRSVASGECGGYRSPMAKRCADNSFPRAELFPAARTSTSLSATHPPFRWRCQ